MSLCGRARSSSSRTPQSSPLLRTLSEAGCVTPRATQSRQQWRCSWTPQTQPSCAGAAECGSFSPPQPRPRSCAVDSSPVYRILRRQTTTADFLNRIERLKAEVSPDPNEILDCARLAPPSAARTTPGDRESASAVNGQYILTLTTADVLALGGDPTIKENYGEFRLVLDNGRWVSTQRNPPACTWSYGTYSLTDGRIELVVIDAGGMAPTHSASKAGEVAAYTVSRYRGTMCWSTVSDASSPEGVAYKPWRRQPDRPPRQFLDRHCTPPDAAFAH